MGALNIAKIGHRNLRTEYQTSGEVFIPIARVKPLVKILMMNKVDLRSLLKDTGLQFQDLSETDQTINFLQYKQLIINARRLLPHHPFALYLGEQSFLHHDGVLAARIMSSENVQQAMELLTKYQPLFTQILGFKFEMQKSGL
ncbi:AraC family transcriptional regulator ligand-binding domain-containing protein, partial [Oleiphilus sp. HI0061]